jgi:hypothetical protein
MSTPAYCKTDESLKEAVRSTLQRNHPELAVLFEKPDKELFNLIDKLLVVKDFKEFKEQCVVLSQKYPLFDAHVKAMKLPEQEVYKRFLNHRAIAKPLFDVLKS